MIKLGELTGIRAILRDGCTGKERFQSYAAAEVEVGRCIKKYRPESRPDLLTPYSCPHCHSWHIGHRKY